MKALKSLIALFTAAFTLISGTLICALAAEDGKYSVRLYYAEDLTLLPQDGSTVVASCLVDSGVFHMPEEPTRPGFEFSGWVEDGAVYWPGDAVYVTSDRVFYAQWTAAYPFTDVAETADYFYDVIDVYERGLMTGTTPTAFSPDGTFTRAMMWTVLARINGVETGGDPWYAQARDWAMEAGISDGTEPDRAMSRQEMVTLLYRAAGSPAVQDTAQFAAFLGADQTADWAQDAMWWGIQTGVNEYQPPSLNPTGAVSRSEVAVSVARFCDMMEEAVSP